VVSGAAAREKSALWTEYADIPLYTLGGDQPVAWQQTCIRPEMVHRLAPTLAKQVSTAEHSRVWLPRIHPLSTINYDMSTVLNKLLAISLSYQE
jgi:hypothetical protein